MSAIERIMTLYDSRTTNQGAGCIELFDFIWASVERRVLEAPHFYSFVHIPQYLKEDLIDELPIYPFADVDLGEDW